MYSITLPFVPRLPFDFAHSLAAGAASCFPDERAARSGLLRAAISVDGTPAALLITSAPDSPTLRCTLVTERPLAERQQRQLAERAAFWLSLEDDLRPFYALADADPTFAPLRDRLYGYHQVKLPSAFEAACWAVLADHTPAALARRRHAALAARFGASLVVDSAVLTAFPQAARLAEVSPVALLPYAGDTRRAAQLTALARVFRDVDEAWLRGGPYDAVARWLDALPGSGPSFAATVLVSGLGRMEQAPLADPALLTAVARHYGDAGPEAAARIAARYGPWQGYWALYLTSGPAGQPARLSATALAAPVAATATR